MNLVNLELRFDQLGRRGCFQQNLSVVKNCIFQNMVKLSNIAVEPTLFVNFPHVDKTRWKLEILSQQGRTLRYSCGKFSYI